MKKLFVLLIALVFVIGIPLVVLNHFWGISIPLSEYWGLFTGYLFEYWPYILFLGVSGFLYRMFDELEDASVRNRFKNDWWIFKLKWLNAKLSSKNKWQIARDGQIIFNTKKHWYYFGTDPKYIERFYLSSTALVFLTDGEHFFQFMKNRMIEVAILPFSIFFSVFWFLGATVSSFIKEKYFKHLD